MPYFGFKAKPESGGNKTIEIVLCLILDSRQNHVLNGWAGGYIVLCLILDSRQNGGLTYGRRHWIVLCLILDSRQNQCVIGWIGQSNCTVPYFGFKAKPPGRLKLPFFYCTVPCWFLSHQEKHLQTAECIQCNEIFHSQGFPEVIGKIRIMNNYERHQTIWRKA